MPSANSLHARVWKPWLCGTLCFTQPPPALVSSAWPGSSHPLLCHSFCFPSWSGQQDPGVLAGGLGPLGAAAELRPCLSRFPGPLSSLGKSKCSLGSCGCSVLCSLQSVISVFLCLVWCPALPGWCFAFSGRSEEGSRARCSAGIDQPWCVYISEMLPF